MEIHLHLTQGDLAAALRRANSTNWTEIAPPHFRGTHHFVYAYEYGDITRAQVRIAQAWPVQPIRSSANLTQAQPAVSHLDHLPDVLAYLERQSQVAATSGLMCSRIKVYAPQALAYYALGDLAQAMKKLGQALSLAEPKGYICIFVDEGAPGFEAVRDAFQRNFTEFHEQDAATAIYVDGQKE